MKAIRYHEYGGSDRLVLEEVPIPVPGEGEVLINMKASAVNPWDWKLRSGKYKDQTPVTFPFIPGIEGAGVIESVGPGVTRLNTGDSVYGNFFGTYGEYAIAPESKLFVKPYLLAYETASAIPVASQTAWSTMIDIAGIHRGHRVLIHGAAGSVGSFAVQLAKWAGGYIFVTASAEYKRYLQSIGADRFIDYRTAQFEGLAKDIDVVLDTIGGEILERSWKVLKKGGLLISIVTPPSQEKADDYGVRAVYRNGGISDEGLRQIESMVNEGALLPVVRRIFPLEEAAEAQDLSESGHGKGKVVLRISE